mgnify:CR=1 FL=1
MDAIEHDLEEAEGIIDGLEDKVDDLREENAHLRRELALSSPRNVEELIASVNEYLDWVDSPNKTMTESTVTMVRTQLRGAVDDALLELR